MGLFKKRPAQQAPAAPTVAESLQKLVETSGRPSLFAHSEFVKQVDCPRCGARKRLPSKTAYLYCDHCGSLIDYDFRLANSGTNAGLTNTVFHQLIAPVQGDIGGGEVPCQNCGAPLSFPVGASGIECPYCHTGTHRL
jgi:LSD1 subclass zinc finger protein